MNALAVAVKEIIGLFVDAAGLALFAALAIAFFTALTKLGFVPPLFGAFGLLLGCAASLAASLLRAKRKR